MNNLKMATQKIVEKPSYIFLSNIWKLLFPVISVTWFVFVIILTVYTVITNTFWDFEVFYSSAQAALMGENVYRVYGIFELPYWYFPWTSWLFIPFTVFSFSYAKIILTLGNFLSLAYIIWSLDKYFKFHAPRFLQLFIFATAIFMCWLLFKVGQIDFILAALVFAVMFMLDRKQYIQAGLILPILLFKPHLLIIFFPFVIIRGGKKVLFSSIACMVVLSLISFILIPNWPLEMIRILKESGLRTDNVWDFITFTELIGVNENWSGTGNIPLAISLMLISFIVVWKNQHLPTIPLLILALSASMFCAPRAYTYNLPFILPSILWLSLDKPKLSILVWSSIAILSYVTRFSTAAYLIVIVVFIFSIIKSSKLKTDSE